MDNGFVVNLENPKAKAFGVSKLFFLWMVKICRRGKETLDICDLHKPLTSDESEKVTDALEQNWEAEIIRCKQKIESSPSFLRAIVKTFFWRYMFYGVILFVQIMIKSLLPMVLGYFINLFSNKYLSNYQDMIIYGVILSVLTFVGAGLTHHVEFGQTSIGMRARVAVSSLVYRKMLKLSHKSQKEIASGMIVNLLSNDVGRFDLLASNLHFYWIVPIQTVVIAYLMWQEVQFASLAGVLSMVVFTLPVQAYLSRLTARYRLKTALRTDYRVKIMSEIISGIQVIKMYAWEKPFEKVVQIARKKEIAAITSSSYLRAIYISSMVFIERLSLFLTLVTNVALGNPIKADQVFSLAQYCNVLQMTLAIFLPMTISFTAETAISLKRLQTFLLLEEKEETRLEKHNKPEIIFENINAAWSTDKLTVENINFVVPDGSLCAIVGPVGAGKSSLLQIILKELPFLTGSVKLHGKISYASQEPWIFGSSVKTNILFGKEYNKLRYKTVVEVCALQKDFQQFPQGDRTIVGERGVSLSGGQRARINLARAVYSEADIYLFDDPLSAVDTHVGKHLFESCILGYLNGKTRILVTHQLQYLKKADLIIVINDGCIEAQGTFDDLTQSNLDFTKLLVRANECEDVEPAEKIEKTIDVITRRKLSLMSIKSFVSDSSEGEKAVGSKEEMIDVNSKPLKDYIKASGNCFVLLLTALLLVFSQVWCSGTDYWVSYWTEQEEERYTLNNTYTTISQNFFLERIFTNTGTMVFIKSEASLYFYAFLIGILILLMFMRSFVCFTMAMRASRELHKKMFHSLLRTPMRFFDINPCGRVLNRFSKDMGAIDEFLPRALIDAIQITLVMSGIIAMVLVANYYMIVPIIILGFVFLKLRSSYISTARNVKNLEGITKSPVFSHLSSSLDGIITIRALKAETILSQEFDKHQDIHTASWFLTIATRCCFGLWLDLISSAFITTAIFGFILLHYYSNVNGSLVGLALNQVLILTGMLQYGIRQTAESINQLSSVDRVMQYTRLESEYTDDLPEPEDQAWPNKGLIEFRSLSLRYSEFDAPVLLNLNIYIEAQSKVGVVGRTGAGKSSLISALFRLAPTEGSIIIDSVDTKYINLNYLRKKISIIPQEPILFSASIRYNLDPFSEFDDNTLWNALAEVELKESISSLDFEVFEGGSNFSVGQRQLVCLARAILRKNTILILDEATANVDPGTDSLIQTTIRKKFENCTVITIAHRLNTIMDSDKIIVMDFGKMVEFNHPYTLLEDPNSYFSKLVAETGATMAHQLKEISKNCLFSTTKL